MSAYAGALAAALLGVAPALPAGAEPLPEGRAVAERINAREDGETRSQRVRMELTDRRGKSRVREVRSYRKDYDDERRTLVVMESPKNIRGTGFLTFDYSSSEREDDSWLYVPALRKVRRISAADRGGYFLGTDFTYEDIKNGNKVPVEDYGWRTVGEEELEGRRCYVIEGVPVSEDVADELGYGRVRLLVDPEIWVVRRFLAWDTRGNELKTVDSRDIKRVDGILTPFLLEARNHKTGHQTRFVIHDVEYDGALADSLFTRDALSREGR